MRSRTMHFRFWEQGARICVCFVRECFAFLSPPGDGARLSKAEANLGAQKKVR